MNKEFQDLNQFLVKTRNGLENKKRREQLSQAIELIKVGTDQQRYKSGHRMITIWLDTL